MDRDNDLLKEMGHKLSQLRQNQKDIISQMADRLGVWRSTNVRNENGETPLSYKAMIAMVDHYGVSLDWLGTFPSCPFFILMVSMHRTILIGAPCCRKQLSL
ncbi:MAG: helix-turn-helix transcriptional regulator [Candidatus Aminicenantes bacterium]|nr:helix-turn-helix transcriptional regulator [Candidatus Aminicenantes bacterium]